MSLARLVGLTVLLAGCASALPGEVAHEGKALDLDACLRGDAACVKTGTVTSSEAIFEGNHAVSLTAPASIDLPLLPVSGGKRLRWLALGLRAYDSSTNSGGKFTVTIGGRTVNAAPDIGFTRMEIDMNELVPAPGTRVTLAALQGQFEFVYAVGRWDE